MKSFNRLIKNIALLAVTVLAVSCNGIINTTINDLPENYLKISQAAPRTVSPDFVMNDFDTLVLSGIYPYDETLPIEDQTDNIVSLGSWITSEGQTAYEKICSSYIAIPSIGKWYFLINAGKHSDSENETRYQGSKVHTMVRGENNISFTLNPIVYDTTGFGDILVDFKLTGIINVSDYQVSAVLTEPESTFRRNFDLELCQVFDENGISVEGEYVARLNAYDIPSGNYELKFYVSKEDSTYGTLANIITKRQFVTVTNGVTSKLKESSFEISEELINNAITSTTFTISYDLAGGIWVDSYTPPLSYVTYEKNGASLPSIETIERPGFVFDGWYKAADSSQEILPAIPYETRGNLDLVAKWHWDTDQVVSMWKGGDEGTIESLTFSWDPVPGATGYKIYEINTDLSEYEFDSEIYLKADIEETSCTGRVDVSNNVFYAVKAYCNDAYEGGEATSFSNVLKYEKIDTLPAPVISLNNGTISWDSVYGADFYRVYSYSTTSDDFNINDFSYYSNVEADSVTENSYNCSSSFSNDYYYAVKAYNSFHGDYSEISNVVKIGKAVPPVISYEDGTISWPTFSGSVRYNAYFYETTDFYAVSEEESGTLFDTANLNYRSYSYDTQISVENNSWVKYQYYAIRVTDGSSTTAFSNVVRINPDDINGPLVTIGDADSTGNSLVSWTSVTGATGYEVYGYYSSEEEVDASDVVNSSSIYTLSSGNVNSCTATNKRTTENMFIVIRALNANDDPVTYRDSNVYMIPKYDYSDVPELTLSGSYLRWTEGTGVSDTYIYKYETEEDLDVEDFDVTLFGPNNNNIGTTSGFEYNIPLNLSTETNVYYAVKYFSSDFGTSAKFSNVVKQAKRDPAALNVTNLSDDFVLWGSTNYTVNYELTWDSLGSGITYYIYRSETEDFSGLEPYAQRYDNTYTVIFSGSEKGYYFAVKASDGTYESEALCEPVYVNNVKQGDFSLTYTSTSNGKIDWASMPGAANYDVYYSQRSSGTETTGKSGFSLAGSDLTGTTYTKTSYNSSDYWTFYVVAKDTSGNIIGVSNYVGY